MQVFPLFLAARLPMTAENASCHWPKDRQKNKVGVFGAQIFRSYLCPVGRFSSGIIHTG